jgi:hypothetical protein
MESCSLAERLEAARVRFVQAASFDGESWRLFGDLIVGRRDRRRHRERIRGEEAAARLLAGTG